MLHKCLVRTLRLTCVFIGVRNVPIQLNADIQLYLLGDIAEKNDAIGAFDGIKDFVGLNDTVYKRE